MADEQAPIIFMGFLQTVGVSSERTRVEFSIPGYSPDYWRLDEAMRDGAEFEVTVRRKPKA